MKKLYEAIDPNLPQAEWEKGFERMYDIHSLAIRLEETEYEGIDKKSPRGKIFAPKAAEISKKLG